MEPTSKVKPIGSFTYHQFKECVSELDSNIGFENLRTLFNDNVRRKANELKDKEDNKLFGLNVFLIIISIFLAIFLIGYLCRLPRITLENHNQQLVVECNKGNTVACLERITEAEKDEDYALARAISGGYTASTGKVLPIVPGDMHLYSLSNISISRGGLGSLKENESTDDCLIIHSHGNKFLISPDGLSYQASKETTLSDEKWNQLVIKKE